MAGFFIFALMKHFVGLLLAIVVITACTGPAVETRIGSSQPELAAIDSLMQYQPDSALTLLLDKPDDTPYYQLLLSEALYKNYYDQKNRLELLDAMAYFDSVGCAFLAARCHYMNGVGYYEMDSVVPACSEYLKAVEIMEYHFSKDELTGYRAKFMALNYTFLANLFSNQYLSEQSIYYGKMSLHYYNNYNAEPKHLAWILNEIGTQYHILEQWDSALYYYNKAFDIMPDINTHSYRDIATGIAYLTYQTEKNPQAVLEKLRWILSQSENEKERLSRSAVIGEIFYLEKQYDSALIYLEPVYHKSQKNDLKKQAAEYLGEIYKRIGKDSEVIDCSNYLASFGTADENNGAIKSQLAKLYNNFDKRRLVTTHINKTRKHQRAFGVLLVMSFVIVVFFMVLHFLNKRKLIKRETEYQAALNKAKTTIEHLQHSELQKAPIEEYTALMKDGCCINIKQRTNKMEEFSSFDVKSFDALALSDKDIADFFQAIDRHCPNFSKILSDKYPSLKANELKLCRFYLLDLSIIQVAVLLGTDYSSIRKRTYRLKEKMHCEELSQQLKLTLFE